MIGDVRSESTVVHTATGRALVNHVQTNVPHQGRENAVHRGFVGAVKVTRASSSGPTYRRGRCSEAKACQTRMVWLPSTRLFSQIRDEPKMLHFSRKTKPNRSSWLEGFIVGLLTIFFFAAADAALINPETDLVYGNENLLFWKVVLPPGFVPVPMCRISVFGVRESAVPIRAGQAKQRLCNPNLSWLYDRRTPNTQKNRNKSGQKNYALKRGIFITPDCISPL